MTDNDIKKALELCATLDSGNCKKCPCREICNENDGTLTKLILDLINRQKAEIEKLDKARKKQAVFLEEERGQKYELINKLGKANAEIERLNKNYEELIYKTECLLCHATGNKFSKYTYTTQEMISFADDYIQDCCDEAIEETKASVKSEAIKEFIDELKNRVVNKYEYTDIRVFKEIDNLVKEMTEVQE